MTHNIETTICNSTGADTCFHIEDVQSLWSGYGKIMRYGLRGGDRDRVVVKYVKFPDQLNHPRGWNSNLSHQRKVKSYQVESVWYRDWGKECDKRCRIPDCLALESVDNDLLMVFEDLDASGFSVRKDSVTMAEMQACLRWLANFHATFIGKVPTGLWEVGTYWHLDTRPDELAALDDVNLKRAAAQIDLQLRNGRYQTFVHGDAKLANFCFSAGLSSDISEQVAAVDFQYVGGGCGMKDVAYFIGSCLNETDCADHEAELLNYYFSELGDALKVRNSAVDLVAIEQEWRSLYPVAWTDFHRFMKAWSPGHWKIHTYSERVARDIVARVLDA